MTHTPTPWIYKRAIKPNGIEKSMDCAIVDREGEIIAETFGKVAYNKHTLRGAYLECPSEANAAFIVRCVNSHAPLVAALSQLTHWAELVTKDLSMDDDEDLTQDRAMIQSARAALAAAKGA